MVGKTLLYNEHLKQGGKIIDFAGFKLPVWFDSLKKEHLAVRQDAGMFDISHMGILKLSGPGAYEFLKKITCNHVDKTLSEKIIYSMILNEDGMVLDDIMFGKCQDSFYVIVNASNKDKILNWFAFHKDTSVLLTDMSETHSFIAVQGPNAVQKLSDIFNQDLHPFPRFKLFETTLFNTHCIMMRSGYTGEDGYEIIIPNSGVVQIWNQLFSHGITPCGLGARDTLRLEYGLPLYGHEVSEEIHPFMTRYSWVVKFDHDFIGKEALLKLKDQIPDLVSVGFKMDSAQIARADYPVTEGGYVSSGTMSPSLNQAIGLAFVKPEFSSIGSRIHVKIRDKDQAATIVPVPFCP